MVTFLLGLKFGNFLGNLHDWKFWKATHSCGNFLKILVYFQSENLSVNYSIHQIDQGIRLYTIIQSKTNWIPEISLNWAKHSSPEMNREYFFFLSHKWNQILLVEMNGYRILNAFIQGNEKKVRNMRLIYLLAYSK